MRVALYTRTSAADVGTNAGAMLAELRRYAVDVRSWEIVAEWTDEEKGIRGRRPGFLALTDAIKAGQVQGVVTNSLARLVRSLSHLADVSRLLEEHKVDLVAIDDIVDTTDPGGRVRWRDAAQLLQRVQRAHRSEAVKISRVKEAIKGVDDGWGHPIAVVNPLELAGLYHGRPGQPPVSIKRMAKKLGVSEGTARKRVFELLEAGKLDESERRRNLEAAGGLSRGGRPSRARIDEGELVALWQNAWSVTAIRKRFHCGADKIEEAVAVLRKRGDIDDAKRAAALERKKAR